MTKAELVDIVAEKVEGATKAQVSAIYDEIFKTIVRAVKEDPKHRFAVKDFGTFKLKERAARVGRNPMAKEGQPKEINIPASTTIGFSAAAAVKEIKS
ncbi:MAG: HU family DNA-binding protein [Candidatus Sumerlaeia bacterium]|nr:HU family DNA-binding protein [Candidatus Sumerlaeia bacterium]